MEMASKHRNNSSTAARMEQLEHLPNKEGVGSCQIWKAARAAAVWHRIGVVREGLLARGRRIQRYM